MVMFLNVAQFLKPRQNRNVTYLLIVVVGERREDVDDVGREVEVGVIRQQITEAPHSQHLHRLQI